MTQPELDDSSAPAAPPSPEPPPVRRAWPAKWIALLLITLASVGVDQWSKQWAHNELQYSPGRRVALVDGYLAMTYVRNPGAAWGFLARAKESFRRPFFIGISVLAMAFILYLFLRLERGQRLMMIALALVFSGAIGNFIDRLRYGFVVDFIDFHIRQRFKWPTFNVADVAITVGVVLLFMEMFLLPGLRARRQRRADATLEQERTPES